jgi:hypothetical protein
MTSKIAAAIGIIQALAEAIRELKEVPSGELYAHVMGVMDVHQYERSIGVLKGAGLVEEQNHLLRWVGPQVQS